MRSLVGIKIKTVRKRGATCKYSYVCLFRLYTQFLLSYSPDIFISATTIYLQAICYAFVSVFIATCYYLAKGFLKSHSSIRTQVNAGKSTTTITYEIQQSLKNYHTITDWHFSGSVGGDQCLPPLVFPMTIFLLPPAS